MITINLLMIIAPLKKCISRGLEIEWEHALFFFFFSLFVAKFGEERTKKDQTTMNSFSFYLMLSHLSSLSLTTQIIEKGTDQELRIRGRYQFK